MSTQNQALKLLRSHGLQVELSASALETITVACSDADASGQQLQLTPRAHGWSVTDLGPQSLTESRSFDSLSGAAAHAIWRLTAPESQFGRYRLSVQTRHYGLYALVDVQLVPADTHSPSTQVEGPAFLIPAAQAGARACPSIQGLTAVVTQVQGHPAHTTRKAIAASALCAVVAASGGQPPTRERVGSWHQESATGPSGEVPSAEQLLQLLEAP